MRAKVVFAVLAGMLFCGLSMLEMPEFLRLTDDTSNDFIFSTVQDEAPIRAEGVEYPADITYEGAGVTRSPVPIKVLHSGPEACTDKLLHRLCVLRT